MDTQRPETMEDINVIELLIHQHSVIQDLFAEVEHTEGKQRRKAWQQLVRLLAVHETAEEEIVHPLARGAVHEGDAIVDDRLREEHDAKVMLQQLDGMNPDSDDFLPLLRRLRDAVLEHARAEERYEFGYLESASNAEQLRAMARLVRAAEAVAPTHPHPGIESGYANVALGAPIAIADRVRDAIRRAKGGS